MAEKFLNQERIQTGLLGPAAEEVPQIMYPGELRTADGLGELQELVAHPFLGELAHCPREGRHGLPPGSFVRVWLRLEEL